MALESNRNVTVTAEDRNGNKVPLGTFDKKTGGLGDSQEVKYAPGGMAPEISFGGRPIRWDLTLVRAFLPERDLPILRLLDPLRGISKVTVSDQYLDEHGNTFGDPVTPTGKLKSVQDPDADSESNNVAMFTLTVGADADRKI